MATTYLSKSYPSEVAPSELLIPLSNAGFRRHEIEQIALGINEAIWKNQDKEEDVLRDEIVTCVNNRFLPRGLDITWKNHRLHKHDETEVWYGVYEIYIAGKPTSVVCDIWSDGNFAIYSTLGD